MSKIKDAVDAIQQHEGTEQRRPAKRFPPAQTIGYTSVWAPTMTEQKRREHEQYVAENKLPF